MTDYFALLGEARRPWLDPENLKVKYFSLARERPADAELNEAFRVLTDPKWRLHHLLILDGADLAAGRDVPPAVADLFWNTGKLLREIDRWLLRQAEATSALSRALLSGERGKLEGRLRKVERELAEAYRTELAQLRDWNPASPLAPNDRAKLIAHHDAISYLTRLRDQVREKQLRLIGNGDA